MLNTSVEALRLHSHLRQQERARRRCRSKNERDMPCISRWQWASTNIGAFVPFTLWERTAGRRWHCLMTDALHSDEKWLFDSTVCYSQTNHSLTTPSFWDRHHFIYRRTYMICAHACVCGWWVSEATVYCELVACWRPSGNYDWALATRYHTTGRIARELLVKERSIQTGRGSILAG